jgi:hypothetical protein
MNELLRALAQMILAAADLLADTGLPALQAKAERLRWLSHEVEGMVEP